jgi:glycosyltransferase involved in cell wall biosynthesis
MKSDASVAVIIPYYNGSQFIERSVRSVLAQTVQAAEFIIIDDGSTPDEADRLDTFAATVPGVRVVRKPNGGQGSARNLGVEVTRAPYICCLDQDDFFLPDHIETLLKSVPADDPRFGFVYADLNKANEAGQVLETNFIRDRATHPKRDLEDMLSRDMFVLPSASLISRSAFTAVGGFDPQFTGYEDDDLFMRIVQGGYSNYFVDVPVTVWCIHQASTTYGLGMVRSRYLFLLKLMNLYPENRYFTEFMLPRFSAAFFQDVLYAQERPAREMQELLDILSTYSRLVCRHPAVSPTKKFAIALRTFILTKLPLRAARSILHRTHRLSQALRG